MSLNNLFYDGFWGNFAPMLVALIKFTIPLASLSFVFGVAIGCGVALIRIAKPSSLAIKIAQKICVAYLSIIRGTPLLVQLFIVFYGLPSIAVALPPFISALVAFSLSIGAYGSEILRASILSVPKGQWEAAYSIGMTPFRAFHAIIAPQAFRVALPPLSNSFIATIKDTSLASAVLVAEMFRTAQTIASQNYEFLAVYTQAALIYWVVCIFLYAAQTWLEARYSRHL